MKNLSQWHKTMALILKRQKGLIELTPRQFLEVELGLFLVSELLPDAPPSTLPALLSGYELPFEQRSSWNEAQNAYIDRARFVIGAFKHKSVWMDLLTKYKDNPEYLRGFSVNADLTEIEKKAVSICSDRFKIYKEILAQPLPVSIKKTNWAQPGEEFTAECGDSTIHFRLPENISFQIPKPFQIPSRESTKPLIISREEWVKTAQWIENTIVTKNLKRRGWVNWATQLQLETFNSSLQKFEQSNSLKLDGATNIIGMLSAGKSSLMDMLAIWAARNGRRITLIVGDVGDVLNRCDYFQQLGLNAVPLLGKSNRETHLKRLHSATAENRSSIHSGYRWLSTACSLLAFTQEPIQLKVGKHPCLNLQSKENKSTYACPIYNSCAYHNAQRELVDAPIWIGTPASLLYSKVDQQLTDTSMQLAELVYKTSDIVVVDEADRVQVQLDMAFSPGQTLASNNFQGWLEQLVNHLRAVQTKKGREVRVESLASTFLSIAEKASTACDRLYDLFNRNGALKKWLNGKQYFSGWLLFEHLADKLIQERMAPTNGKRSHLPEIFENFLKQRDPLGEESESELCALARKVITHDLNRSRLQEEIIRWVEEQEVFDAELTNQLRAEIALKLEFTLLVSVLENRLNYLIKHWKQVESSLDLDKWGSNIFNDPPKEFLSMVPISAAGNMLAFRYEGSDENPAGKLAFFKNMGVGRHFLLNFHRIYEADKQAGPHVLLLSGTSWAGSSPSYHIQLPVAALLRSPKNELNGISKSEFHFYPFRDKKDNPIRVSGESNINTRQNNLKSLVRELAKADPISKYSLFENHWKTLPVGRRRSLLIVGSYQEARLVKDYLIQIRSEWSDKVQALIPDSSEPHDSQIDPKQTIIRSKVQSFALGDGHILIAPLLAIERGHNILNDAGEAGIGVAYFLVRPHPHPDDISLAVKSLNRWAIDTHNNYAWFEQKTGNSLSDAEQISNLFKHEAVKRWNQLMRMPIRFPTMREEYRNAFYWDQLVSIWQVIGRLIRGGVPAQVYFCDAAFAPNTVKGQNDTPQSSLLVGILALLQPYFDTTSKINPEERAIAQALYTPFFQALNSIKGLRYDIRKDSPISFPAGIA